MEILKISAKSNPKSVAGAIAAVVEKNKEAELVAIGAGAVNQAAKAIAIARGYLAPRGIDLSTVIAFAKVDVEGIEKTAMRFIVKV
ncbi:MAG: stage V sporulation protein S [Candidatus Wallbacteria bacterium]|nr:stage V sporulation protein S [Candidatus Wallbacteria bacterium]